MCYLQRTTGDPFRLLQRYQALRPAQKSKKSFFSIENFGAILKMVATVNRTEPFVFHHLDGVSHRYRFSGSVNLLFLSRNSASPTPSLIFSLHHSHSHRGTFTSLPRYVLLCFPSFILLGQLLARHPPLAPGNYPHLKSCF